MNRKIAVLLIAILLFAGSSFLAVAGDAKTDKKALQGTWTFTKGDEKVTMTFTGSKFKFEFKGMSAEGTFSIDPTKSPKTMDMTITKGIGDKVKEYEGKTAKALYDVEKNKFKWIANEPGKDERPDAFPKEGEAPKGLYIVFERAKK